MKTHLLHPVVQVGRVVVHGPQSPTSGYTDKYANNEQYNMFSNNKKKGVISISKRINTNKMFTEICYISVNRSRQIQRRS